jgi:hypothetical protein
MARRPAYVQLLHGPYTAPALRRGDRATCLFRDGEVIITSWSDGRISWPRCRLPGTHGGGSGLLVDAELARAVRLESSLALQYWWGVNAETVWRWRQALGVPRFNEGSARVRKELNAKTADSLRGKKLPTEQVEQRRRSALALNLAQYMHRVERPDRWTPEELALVGTLPDAEVAARIGRTESAVRTKRARRGFRSPCDRRRRENRLRASASPGPAGFANGQLVSWLSVAIVLTIVMPSGSSSLLCEVAIDVALACLNTLTLKT